MIQQSRIKIQKEDDIVSVCSIEDKPSNRIICAIPAHTNEIPDSESDYSNVHMLQAQVQKDHSIIVPVPHIPVKIYLNKYSKPITVIAFIDTGTANTIINPDVLPLDW
ncbi:hypothetical protein PVK06_004847 [Gossypium arboreum]|uniref:Uncharacterized protein n=1 Tax=Gossypium arboreum TaxID=29729 RepID=A0ABR0QUA6_GOSAR|nr:hypothetical protein PVK06_004847 [Gossypium arboreum]